MANLYDNLPAESAQARANEQKRRIAEAMMAQGMEAQTPYTSAGRYVVPMSWSQGLNKVAQAMLGAYGIRKSQESEQALASDLQAKQQQAVRQYQDSQSQPFVASAPSISEDGSGTPGSLNMSPTQDQLTASKRQKLMEFLTNQYAPESAKQAAVLTENWNREDANSAANRELVRQNRLDELAFRAEQLKATAENARLSIEQRAEAARQHDETLRAIAAMNAAGRTPPAPSYTTVVDPKDPTRLLQIDGREYKPGGSLGDPGVIGIAGKEPAAAKAEEQRGVGRQAADEQIGVLRGYYGDLERGGGIVSTDEGKIHNAKAWLQSSGLGQWIGDVVGTENQSTRQTIAMTRPALLRSFMAATGMSARQVDSNAELKLWLATATDPTKTLQANRAALDNLEKFIGSQGAKPNAATTVGTPAGTVIQYDAQGNRIAK